MNTKRLFRLARYASAVSLTTATAAFAQVGEIPSTSYRYDHGPGMMWGTDQWGGFGMVLGPIFMVLILVGIVAGAIYLIRLSAGTSATASSQTAAERPLAILKERFARGEMDAKEFEERRALLTD